MAGYRGHCKLAGLDFAAVRRSVGVLGRDAAAVGQKA